MRIKQKELIGKLPRIGYTKTLPDKSIVIVQVFDNPKCVNMIKKVDGKIVERQCYPLTDEMYQKYIDNYNKYGTHSQVSISYVNRMTNESKGLMKIFWTKLRNYLWN